jgi:hypothetical protein
MAPREESDKVQIRRVRVSDEANRVLEQIAKKYGCTYKGRLSISGLLSQIADGRLQVSRPDLAIVQQTRPDLPILEKNEKPPLLKLEIEVLSNLNGTIAEITKKIRDVDGNIYRARAVENSKNSHIQMAISIPQKCSLTELIRSFYEITIKDILKFNEEDKLEKLLEIVDPHQKRRYEDYKSKKDKNANIQDFFDSRTIDYKSEKLIQNIIVTVGFKVIMNNDPGSLCTLAQLIAEKHISISSINLNYDPYENQYLVNFCLGFSPVVDKMSEKIESIYKLMKSLEGLDFVERVEQLDAGPLDYEKELY